jgi:hypothetical protein
MIFDLFTTNDYTFLRLDSKTGGNQIVTEYEANGIFKLRSGMVQVDNMESFGGGASQEAAATLHIRPTETFLGVVDAELVGHGIRVSKDGTEPTDYRIIGQVEGFDFDAGTLEFYKVTLKRESIWQDGSDLPLA